MFQNYHGFSADLASSRCAFSHSHSDSCALNTSTAKRSHKQASLRKTVQKKFHAVVILLIEVVFCKFKKKKKKGHKNLQPPKLHRKF